MLLALRIENFALIDSLDLELGPGLNVLTGETGAGKSIILDAIDAVLGGKVPGRVVRTGADRATIEATFQSNPQLSAWLKTQGLPATDPLVCSRDISSNRLRLRLNGASLTKRQAEALREQLVEITAQGQTIQLGQPSLQREWLDSFGGLEVVAQRQAVAQAFSAYQQACQILEQRRKAESDRLQQLDLFEYQLQELETANLEDPEELEHLLLEQQRLSHTVELQQQSYQVYQALYQNDQGMACADLLGTAESLLQDMANYDPEVQGILELVSTALTQVEEAGRQINTYGDSLETDPERLGEVEARILELKQICRKYGPTLADAIAHYRDIQGSVDRLTGGGQSIADLTAAQEAAQATLQQHCQTLSHLRQRAAQDLESRLIAALKPLAMERVQFQVELRPIAPTVHGADQITFRFSPNPGELLQPLGEIASGGEMSRFLLALKACFSQIDPVGTMIFDEIDVGVSGRVSQAIAQKLHDLSQQHQVLCVTHQPLIAAMADRHFRVHKTVVDRGADRAARPGATVLEAAQEMTAKATGEGAGVQERTIVSVELLADLAARQRELAELAGGESAQEALTFAESLLTQAADRRHLSGTEEATAAPGETPEAESTPLAKSSRRPSTKKTAKSTSSSQKTNQGRPSGQGRAKATRKSRSGS
ncbi:MAG: DNA repair protein RecN [Prochlorothrix sp.]|nr:DNA repair protein RecN [Prochlorothrix sp.]